MKTQMKLEIQLITSLIRLPSSAHAVLTALDRTRYSWEDLKGTAEVK